MLPYLERELAGWLNFLWLQIYPRRPSFLKERFEFDSSHRLRRRLDRISTSAGSYREEEEVFDGRTVSPSPGNSKHFSKGVHHAGDSDPTDCTKNVFLEEVVAVKRDV
ncbi:hypothetical protein U1Q18_049923, partial [Sarracenia purpurea var. burkii]